MKTEHILCMVTLCFGAACGGGNGGLMSPVGSTGGSSSVTTPPSSQTTGGSPASSSGTAGTIGTTVSATPGSSSNTGSTVAGTSGAAIAGSSGSTAAVGGSAANVAGSVADASAGAGGIGTAGATDAAGTGGSGSAAIPTPMTAPIVWGFGVGITDVAAATKFYTDVMMMTVEKDAIKRDDRTETTLYGTQAKRGARLVLMKYDDMRNTRKITAKVVWQAANAAAVNTAASMYPDYVSRLNIGVVQFDGPDTYIQEVGGSFDSGGTGITVPYPVALGFAVSDQPAALKFYTALGMTQSNIGSFSVTDINGTGNIAEYSVKFADGMGIVLQQWTPARPAKDNPIKVVLYVPDAKAMADKVMTAGGTIVTPAARTPVYDNRLLVVAKDLDGYTIEIVE